MLCDWSCLFGSFFVLRGLLFVVRAKRPRMRRRCPTLDSSFVGRGAIAERLCMRGARCSLAAIVVPPAFRWLLVATMFDYWQGWCFWPSFSFVLVCCLLLLVFARLFCLMLHCWTLFFWCFCIGALFAGALFGRQISHCCGGRKVLGRSLLWQLSIVPS